MLRVMGSAQNPEIGRARVSTPRDRDDVIELESRRLAAHVPVRERPDAPEAVARHHFALRRHRNARAVPRGSDLRGGLRPNGSGALAFRLPLDELAHSLQKKPLEISSGKGVAEQIERPVDLIDDLLSDCDAQQIAVCGDGFQIRDLRAERRARGWHGSAGPLRR